MPYVDMKGSDYMDLTPVKEQVLKFNLQQILSIALTRITQCLSPSIVLRKPYSARMDIILEDIYPIAMNMSWSFHGTEVSSCNKGCLFHN